MWKRNISESGWDNNEIRNIVYVRTGRRLGDHTVARVLEEEAVPLKLSRLFEPYHEIQDSRERRWAVVALHLDGWSVKATASYLKISNKTVYRVLGRWLAEGEAGLEDRTPGRPKGVRKVDLATMNDIRRMQENPELGAFRIHAALEQKRGNVEISARTVGRIMAVHRSTYGLDKPKRSPHQKKPMPFAAHKRHQYWTADVRYLKTGEAMGEQLYAVSVLENYSSARSSDLLGNGEMLVMRTSENPAYPLGKLVGPQKTVWLDNLALAVYPLGLDGVEPRALLRQKAAYDPRSSFALALFDLAVMPSEPAPDLPGDVPARVVPDENHMTFLPIPSSFSQHHERNRVVMELTGLPSTKRSHVSPISGKWSRP